MAATKQLKSLIDQMQTNYEGSPWYGNSFVEIMDGIESDLAFWEPNPGAHSIAQLVWHIVYWRQSLIKRLAGDTLYKGSMKSMENWYTKEKLMETGWESIKFRFANSQHEMVSLLQKQNDSLLEEAYSEKATFRDLILGILQHDLYHMGQVAYLKSIYIKGQVS